MGDRARFVRLLLCGGGWLALAGAADAQTPTPDPLADAQNAAEQTTVDEVIVTGSRLPSRDLISASPIVTVTAADFQNAGAFTVETLVNQLPQVVPSFSEAANNPSANGAAYVDLRGLGRNRSIVLLNGRRVVGSDPSNAFDVNIIPPALVARVEVVTGGASAVYGADAVAGVVNFILRDDFTGVQANVEGAISERDDAERWQSTLTAGGRFHDGRGHIAVSLGYASREEVGKGERAFTAQATGPSSFYPSGTFRTSAANLPSQAAVNQVFAGYGVAAGAVPRQGGQSGFGFNGDGSLYATGVFRNAQFDAQNVRRPASETATLLFPDVFSYNFQPENKLILPLDRQSAAAFASYDLSERLELFGEALLTRYTASTALASSPAPTDPNPLYPGLGVFDFTIPVTNPFIPADLRTLLNSRVGNSPALAGTGAGEEFLYRFRATALGPRQTDNEATARHLLAGLRWRFGRDWRLEAYVSLGRYERDEDQGGNVIVRRFEQLLDSPTGGTEFCGGGFNPFGVGLSEACGAFVEAVVTNRTEIEQTVASAIASGPLWTLPAGQVLASVGIERRELDFAFDPDPGAGPGEIAGFFGQDPIMGSTAFTDVFGELYLPILADRAFAHRLDATLGYRRSEGLNSGGVDSWKIEGRWAPMQALRVRGSLQRAVRSPDIFELFSPTSSGGAEVNDPCSRLSSARTPQVLEFCRRQAVAAGLPLDFVDGFGFPGIGANLIQSGNRDLAPETADTRTLGVVWRPDLSLSWLRDVRLSVDGWSIEIEGAIDYRDPQLVINGCYNVGGATNPSLDPANPFCRQLTRSSNDFLIINLATPLVNQSLLATAGVDAAAGARLPLGEAFDRPWLGVVRVEALLSYLKRFEEQGSPLEPVVDSAGTVSGNAALYGRTLPRWRGNLNLGWERDPVSAELRARYIGGAEHLNDRLSPIGDDPLATGTGSAWYFDLSARWRATSRVEVRAGVLNLFDREPEFFEPQIDAGTDPSTYDVVGRRFYAGVSLRW